MLQDAIWANTEKLESDKAYQDTTVKFLKASFQGWIHCRDNPEECRDIVVAAGSQLGNSHQLWQMNEVNALIWPNRLGVGLMDPREYKRTTDIAFKFKVIKKPATRASYRTDLAQKAIANLNRKGLDVNGRSWKKAVVKLRLGGK